MPEAASVAVEKGNFMRQSDSLIQTDCRSSELDCAVVVGCAMRARLTMIVT